MELDKKRERQIKFTIYLVCFVLLVGTVGILFWTDTIQFQWSNELKKELNYKSNKSKEKRVLVIGDSQLEDWPQINCLHNEIEAFCQKNDMGHLSVAHHGFGPIEYLDQLQQVAQEYQPNLIILFYYTGNDLTDVMLRNDDTPKVNTHPPYINEPEKNTKKKEQSTPSKYDVDAALAQFDWDKFRERGIDSLMIEYAKNRIRNPNEIGPEFVNPHVLNMGSWNNNYLIDNNMIIDIKPKGAWFKIIRKFEGILSIADDLGAELCFVSIPSTVQVDESHFEFYQKNTFKTPRELTASNGPQKLIGDFTSANGITYVNLLPHFRAHSTTDKLYFVNDDHLSQLGHEYAFEFVEKQILTPFKNGKQLNKKQRTKNFHLNYLEWAIADQILKIESDSNWLNSIKVKAAEQGISLDSALHMDARYVVRQSLN